MDSLTSGSTRLPAACTATLSALNTVKSHIQGIASSGEHSSIKPLPWCPPWDTITPLSLYIWAPRESLLLGFLHTYTASLQPARSVTGNEGQGPKSCSSHVLNTLSSFQGCCLRIIVSATTIVLQHESSCSLVLLPAALDTCTHPCHSPNKAHNGSFLISRVKHE